MFHLLFRRKPIMYKQLSLIQEQLGERKRLKENLLMQTRQDENVNILPADITFRIQRTLEALEKIPPEKQRGIFENLIQFAEFHPTKLRLGVYTTNNYTVGAAKRSSRSFGSIVGSTTIKTGGEREIRTLE